MPIIKHILSYQSIVFCPKTSGPKILSSFFFNPILLISQHKLILLEIGGKSFDSREADPRMLFLEDGQNGFNEWRFIVKQVGSFFMQRRDSWIFISWQTVPVSSFYAFVIPLITFFLK